MNLFDRAVAWVERIGGLFLFLVVAVTFVSVVLRYFFSTAIPDGFLFACYLQGIAIFWGIACTTYRGSHISVDILWEMSGPRGRQGLDVVARVLSLGFLIAFAWMSWEKVVSTQASGLSTNELHLPVWPFYAMAAAGIAAAMLLGFIRFWRLLRPVEGAADGS